MQINVFLKNFQDYTIYTSFIIDVVIVQIQIHAIISHKSQLKSIKRLRAVDSFQCFVGRKYWLNHYSVIMWSTSFLALQTFKNSNKIQELILVTSLCVKNAQKRRGNKLFPCLFVQLLNERTRNIWYTKLMPRVFKKVHSRSFSVSNPVGLPSVMMTILVRTWNSPKQA